MRGAEQFVKGFCVRFARDDDTARIIQPEIHRLQHERHRRRLGLQPVREQLQRRFGRLAEILTASDGGEFQQRERGNGIAAWFRAVVIILHAENQIGRAGGALPEAAIRGVIKSFNHRLGQFAGEIQMLRFQRRLVKLDDTVEQEGITFEQLNIVTFAVTPAVKERATLATLAGVP